MMGTVRPGEGDLTSQIVRAQVEAANRRFYAAFEALDADAMDDCWAPGDGVACVHPGSPWVTGRDAVMASWGTIMANTGFIELDVEVLDVVVEDPVAWVACVERVRSAGAGAAETAAADVAATNVFVLGAGGWRLTLHHASPVMRGALGG
jgi:ketosteroid isomerase-like protein